MTILQHGVECLAKYEAGEVDELPSVRFVSMNTGSHPPHSCIHPTYGQGQTVADLFGYHGGYPRSQAKANFRKWGRVYDETCLRGKSYTAVDTLAPRRLTSAHYSLMKALQQDALTTPMA